MAKIENYAPLVQKQKELIMEKFKQQAESLVAKYDQYERDTFPIQEAEARAYLQDNNANTPLIDAIAQNRGIDKEALVNKIITKADQLKTAIGSILGKKQKELG
jgi:lipopolysaccharide biosynthesis protein